MNNQAEQPNNPFRHLPSVDSLLQESRLRALAEGDWRPLVVEAVRQALQELRQQLASGEMAEPSAEALRQAAVELGTRQARAAIGPHYRRVINATGIILHTALGRAVLPERAIRAIIENLSGYSLLQADPQTGQRSSRDARIQWLLQRLTGCEAATVVNNNAAATMIVLAALGAGREVIVSRGQLVEIGGSFRLPDVMRQSGVRMVEVGTTNKTHLRDYEQAITDQTAAIMRVHPSNYRIVGFTSEVPLEPLVKLAHSRGLPLIDDVGAGSLIDFSQFGFEPEPTLPQSVAAGADVICSSTDKLIGAGQGGIILGRKEIIGRIRKHPLARVLRVDKITLSVLEATLGLFFDPQTAMREVPTLALLQRDYEQLRQQAQRIAEAVSQRAAGRAALSDEDGQSEMGSGSLPTQQLRTRLVRVQPRAMSVDELALRLRQQAVPVFGRIRDEGLLLDPRTLLADDETVLIDELVAALSDDQRAGGAAAP